mgnify:CR=1 FL=1
MTRHLLKIPLLIPLLLSGAMLPAAAQDRSSGRMMIDGGLFGTVFMLLAVLLLILGIAALIKYLRSK